MGAYMYEENVYCRLPGADGRSRMGALRRTPSLEPCAPRVALFLESRGTWHVQLLISCCGFFNEGLQVIFGYQLGLLSQLAIEASDPKCCVTKYILYHHSSQGWVQEVMQEFIPAPVDDVSPA